MDEIIKQIKEEAKLTLKEMIIEWNIKLRQELTPRQKKEVFAYLSRALVKICKSRRIEADREYIDTLAEEIIQEIEGYGVIEKFIRDPYVTDIMVNGPEQVYIEKNGVMEKVDVEFESVDEIISIIEKMVFDAGRRLDVSSPFVDLRIKEGARVTAVIPPVASESPFFCLRKVYRDVLSFDDLLRFGTVNKPMIEFLRCCVKARLNILISGSTGVGKTTFLNLLLRTFVPQDERVIVLEDTEELVLQKDRHHVKLLTRPPNMEGKGEVFLHDLVKLAMHLRPDRLIVGEVRGDEAFQFLQAANTGHDGSMCTIHANDSEDALVRLEMLSLMSRVNITPEVVHKFMKLGIHVIVHLRKLSDGRRIVSQVGEFDCVNGNFIMKDIFALTHSNEGGDSDFHIASTGYIPSFIKALTRKTDFDTALLGG